MNDRYLPARWLPGANAMTVFASVARVFPRPHARRERWELPDGDFLDLDFYDPPPGFEGSGSGVLRRTERLAEDAPRIIVLHGLEGSSRSSYVRGLVALALSRGLSAVALNFRSCSGELNRLPRLYHSGETSDLDHVVRRLASERPGRPLAVAGFSLGGNVAAKYLGEHGDALPDELRAGAVISVPFDLARSAQAIDGPGFWNRVYRERFLRRLRRKAAAKLRQHPHWVDPDAMRGATTFAAFDDRITARVHGFRSAEEYWTLSSAQRFLAGVRRPLLAIAAKDDPIVPYDTLPIEEARRNPNITLEVTDAGGHVAFVGGWLFWPSFWAERRAVDFLAARLRGSRSLV
jgi:predicted alpha/beta-fold hydrolase